MTHHTTMTRLMILLALWAGPAGAALHAAWYHDPAEPKVMVGGRLMHASTVRAVDEAAALCPGLLR